MVATLSFTHAIGIGAGCILVGDALGSWFGKVAAFILGYDVSDLGNAGSVLGGLVGAFGFAVVLGGMLNT